MVGALGWLDTYSRDGIPQAGLEQLSSLTATVWDFPGPLTYEEPTHKKTKSTVPADLTLAILHLVGWGGIDNEYYVSTQ